MIARGILALTSGLLTLGGALAGFAVGALIIHSDGSHILAVILGVATALNAWFFAAIGFVLLDISDRVMEFAVVDEDTDENVRR